jgi:hypothetical protein
MFISLSLTVRKNRYEPYLLKGTVQGDGSGRN